MQQLLSPAAADVHVDSVQITEQAISVVLMPAAPAARCPTCDHPSTRVHSRYWRHLADLPIRAVPVVLRVHARRFRCGVKRCSQRVFAERLDGVADVGARRTSRLRTTLRVIALANGGEAGARLANRLGLPTSPDTLLRELQQASPRDNERPTPRVLGVDDWAKRKGHSYGTILVDLERRQVVDLLDEATADGFRAWLEAHPGVEVISRDRGGVYAEGGRTGAPDALQVADRFHLMKNLGDAVEVFLSRIGRDLPAKPAQKPATPTPASRQESGETDKAAPEPATRVVEHQHDLRRERYDAVRDLHQRGVSARRIASALDLDRATVRAYLQSETLRPIRRQRRSLLDPFRPYLEERWQAGCHNGRQLFRELVAQGFRGQRAIVANAVATLRRRDTSPQADPVVARALTGEAPSRRESPRRVRWWFLAERDTLVPDDRDRFLGWLEGQAEARQVYDLAQSFTRIVRQRRAPDLPDWLERAAKGPRELQSFANGIKRDRAAVDAALREPWSQGQTEGQINRLKLLKRATYGRAGIKHLRCRLLEAV